MGWKEDMRQFTVENTIYALIGLLSWVIIPFQMCYTICADIGDWTAEVTGIEVVIKQEIRKDAEDGGSSG